MDIDIFKKQEDIAPIIYKDTDADKFQKIVTILCEKRKTLEDTLQSSLQPETEQTLKELITEMLTFGITELDYQKFLVIKAKEGQN